MSVCAHLRTSKSLELHFHRLYLLIRLKQNHYIRRLLCVSLISGCDDYRCSEQNLFKVSNLYT